LSPRPRMDFSKGLLGQGPLVFASGVRGGCPDGENQMTPPPKIEL
jgi:hypothetical protein